ncbi:MAG TPA: glycosyltransferase family 4 protein [Acidobacteriota bacterium]|nr:glycosyltransferase family 4 protein [Acidobacteriota bacterium]
MILYLEFLSAGRRGGELYHRHLHSFLASGYPDLVPGELGPPPVETSSRLTRARYARELVRRNAPRLVVSDISSAVVNLPAVRQLKRGSGKLLLVVQSARPSLSSRTWLKRRLVRRAENYLLRNADIAVTNSRFTAGLVRKAGRPDIPVIVASPGLEVSRSCDSGPRTADRDGVVRLLYVGECSRIKGLIYLIRAMPQLGRVDVVLDVAGGTEQEPYHMRAIQALIDRLGLRQRVTFQGFVDRERLHDLYRRSSLLVMPSLSEGYGMALAEALCFGLPAVVTRVGAVPEMVTDGLTAIVVPPADAPALAGAIDTLLNDPELYRTISQAGQKRAQSLSTWADFSSTLEQELLPHVDPILGGART